MTDSAQLRKASLRSEYLERRRGLSYEEVLSLSLMVQELFVGLKAFNSAKRMALYSSFEGEVLTGLIFEHARRSGKEVYFPKVDKVDRELGFFRVDSNEDLRPGAYAVKEPHAVEDAIPIGLEFLDLVVVPGVVFDLTGGRIGFGKGYYDRVLQGARCPFIALAYDMQIVDTALPEEEHDVKVTSIVTESRILRF